MIEFQPFLEKMTDPAQRQRMEDILNWVHTTYPELEPRLAWNQPMFTHHGTFILGFSVAKAHIAVAPEAVVVARFAKDIDAAGYSPTDMLFRIPWKSDVNYGLLSQLIAFNLTDKANITSFWRK
jgi:hypothetical protein